MIEFLCVLIRSSLHTSGYCTRVQGAAGGGRRAARSGGKKTTFLSSSGLSVALLRVASRDELVRERSEIAAALGEEPEAADLPAAVHAMQRVHASLHAAAVHGEPLRVEGPYEATSGWSSKASEAELKGIAVCRD